MLSVITYSCPAGLGRKNLINLRIGAAEKDRLLPERYVSKKAGSPSGLDAVLINQLLSLCFAGFKALSNWLKLSKLVLLLSD